MTLIAPSIRFMSGNVAPRPARIELGQRIEERKGQEQEEPLAHRPGLSLKPGLLAMLKEVLS